MGKKENRKKDSWGLGKNDKFGKRGKNKVWVSGKTTDSERQRNT